MSRTRSNLLSKVEKENYQNKIQLNFKDELRSFEKISPLPEFTTEFFDQPLDMQIALVERALDQIGLGIDLEGFPDPGEVGLRLLSEADIPKATDLETGLEIEAADTEQAHALSVKFDDEGWVSEIEFTPERQALHNKIVAQSVLGQPEMKKHSGYSSLTEWAKKHGVSEEKSKEYGIFHRGEDVFIPAKSSQGNPIYQDGVGSLLGADHPITLRLANGDLSSLSESDKVEIRQAALKARNGEDPKALFLMGGPAAGKTSGLEQRADLKPEHSVTLNPDDVKDRLPEFKKMVEAGEAGAASLVHRESSRLAGEIKALSTELGLNLVVDGTGNHNVDSFNNELDNIVTRGYKADLLAVDVPTDMAVVRAASRAAESGRWVPEAVIRKTHVSVANNLTTFIHDPRFEQASVFDNSGSKAVEIATASRGNVDVVRGDLYNRLEEKALESPKRAPRPPLPDPPKSGIPIGVDPKDWITHPVSDWTQYLGETLPFVRDKLNSPVEVITGREKKEIKDMLKNITAQLN